MLALFGRAMEPDMPCRDGSTKLLDIMSMMEKYSTLKTQNREERSKVTFYELS